ncbi:Olfactory receptor 14C36 [Sciurus carolinensis]|uniref:Olfactory receptor 14C36 n=1 Tax=Sciurus carolinensis TaxID=30640 RepID=A0AA41NBM4_SCICA|nr:Olfactory receptor 14C36 [Sciurus carolinensis]
MEKRNTTSNFILLGVFEHMRLHLFLFTVVLAITITVMLAITIASLMGNALLILLIQQDLQFHTPMYFLLSQLSLMGIMMISTTAPKMAADYLTGSDSGWWECFPLAPMSYDLYVVVCHPLHYPMLLSRPLCLRMTVAFSHMQDLQVLLATSFSQIYLVTVMGNFPIIVVTTNKSLHSPMFFFLRNLSILDIYYISVTVPKSCMNSLLGSSGISKVGCTAQVFLVVFSVYMELLFLTIMTWDPSIAICQPLYYLVVNTPSACIWMTLASLLSGLVYAAAHTSNTFQLPFCRSNVIQHFFCDISSH